MTLQIVKETTNKNIPMIRGVFMGITALGLLAGYHGRGGGTALVDIIDNPIFTMIGIVALIGGVIGILITYGFDSLTEVVGSIEFSDRLIITQHQSTAVHSYAEVPELVLRKIKSDIFSVRILEKEHRVIINSESNINYLKKLVEEKRIKFHYSPTLPSVF